jgi:putative heme-binding domain-containing protein
VDWAYGKVYAAHLTAEGAGYRATFEPFAEGKAFDGTDLVVGQDGAMYLTIGGRRTQSGLYRITYTGTEPTDPAKPAENPQAAEARMARHKLESFHGKQDSQAVAFAWEYLNSPDRYLRYAARVAIEWQDLSTWQDKALGEKRPTALVNAIVALCRTANPARPGTGGQPPTYTSEGNPALQAKVLAALNALSLRSLSEEQLLEALRAYQLAFIRLGKPDERAAGQLAARLDALYPAPSFGVNRELSQLLAYLNAPSVVPKTMQLLTAARTQEEQLHYVLVLRVVTRGWTPEQHNAYFSWINHAEKNYRGGASFKRFLQRIREDAIKTLTDDEKTALAAVLKGEVTAVAVKETAPRQFVRNWQMQDLVPAMGQATHGRNFERGKAAFDATGCLQCHRFAGDGGSTGPDLTGLGNRFQPADVLESILLPSKVISDQYQPTEIRTKDGDVFIGQVEGDGGDVVRLRTGALSTEAVEVPKANIAVRRPSKLSLMPEGLIDVLSRDEILDLIAYLRSGGNPKDKAFAE